MLDRLTGDPYPFGSLTMSELQEALPAGQPSVFQGLNRWLSTTVLAIDANSLFDAVSSADVQQPLFRK